MKKLLKVFLVVMMLLAIVTPKALTAKEITSNENDYGTNYYLDSNINKKDGDGLTPENAFDSLEDINSKTFQPGDKILIKAGSKFTGTLWPKGSGCAGYPIVIDMYGNGNKPVIDGNGSYFMPQIKDWKGPFVGEDGSQIGAAVYLYNQEYIEINNLDIKNYGDNVNRDRSGIRIEGYDYGVINHIYIRNCNIHDVRGYNGQDDIYPVVPTNEDGSPLDGYVGGDPNNPNTSNTFWGARTTHRTGGINLVTYTARHPEKANDFNVIVQDLDESKKITRFNDILIENNTIENCQANGITTTNVKGTLDDVDFRHTNVVIRGNYIHNVTRAGIIPLYTSNVLVEYNKVDTFQSTTEGYGCGIWCDRANGMIFQYNEVCNGQNGYDGMAFNLDDMTRDGIVQYNYTHDNYGGGYMLHVRQKSYNRNNTIRYNLSINDSGIFTAHNAQIVAVGETDVTKLESAKVYNNTFISNKDCHAVYQGDQVDYTNNIWYFTNPSAANRKDCFLPGANSTFNNNAYIGCVAPEDLNKKTAVPQFIGENNLFNLDKETAYINANLKVTSPYINQGIIVENSGDQDIIGNDLTSLNLGAFSGKGHDVQIASETVDATNVKKYYANGDEQTEVINETASEADEKWVNTTFEGNNNIYTKKLNNYLQFSFIGTGGKLKLKRGAGAGLVKVEVLNKEDQSVIKTNVYNTYNATADVMEIDDFKNLSNDNQEYLVKISNYENGKATNFMSFTSDVVSNENQCKNDELAGVVIEKPMKQTIPYAQDDLAIKLNSHLYFNTCHPIDDDVLVEYKVDNGGTINNDILLVNKPGTYTIEANATYNNKTVNDKVEVIVELGNEPQINVPELNKRALETLISACEALDLDNYSDINKDNFIKVLDDAKKLLELENLNQALIDEMVLKLTDARDALTKIKFNAEDSEVSKKGNWVTLSESTLDKGTALKSGVANEEMALEFFGNEITVYGRKAVGVGIIKFIVTKVSNGSELYNEEIDCYSVEKLDQAKLFSWKGDVNDQYRITIINTGKKNSSATNRDTNTIIDYFTVESLTVDMSNLKQLIALIEQENMNEADYTVESWKTFKIALDNAKALLDNVNATQEEVDLAYNELQTAKDALVKVVVDTNKTALKIAIDIASLISEESLDNVIPVVVEEFKAALSEANDVYNNASATQEQVNNAFDRLASAMQKLEFYKGNKTALIEVIEEANSKQEEDYTADSWKALQKALQEANKVLADENAMQKEVDEATNKLQEALDNLVTAVDKSLLQAFVEYVSGLNSSKYTEATWKTFETELTEANAVLKDANATQEQVDNAYNQLVKAYLDLRLIPDKSLLEELINQAEGLNVANYTKASFDGLTKALNEAKVVYENPNATQKEVDNAKATLEKAINNLEVTPINNGDTTSVKTGDKNLVEMLAGIALLSVTGYMVLRKKENY